MSIADHVSRSIFGRKLAEGTRRVQSDPDVIKAYLGAKNRDAMLTSGISGPITASPGASWPRIRAP